MRDVHYEVKGTLSLVIIDTFFFRAVYDGASPDKFMDRLDVRIKGHDKEIERMCNYHYQGFIESIRSLLQVRGQVESIKVSNSLYILLQTVLWTQLGHGHRYLEKKVSFSSQLKVEEFQKLQKKLGNSECKQVTN